jgi:hypothetical protein
MGNQVVILLFGTLALFAIYMIGFRERGNDLARNTSESFAEASAHEVNRSAMDIAMNELADSSEWRASYSSMSLFNGTTTVTFQDTVVGSDSCIIVRSITRYVAGMDTGYASTKAIVSPITTYVPPVVRGSMTAFRPVDDLIGDMYIDGRDYTIANVLCSPGGRGRFGVSTGQSTFTNTGGAFIGGTYYVGKTGYDLPTTYPEDARIIETNSAWPNGWPTTPDQVIGVPEGTLKSIALSGVDGSQYFTSYAAWGIGDGSTEWPGQPVSPPLHGVTYFDVPAGAYWQNIMISDTSEGILVFHSPATDAYWRYIGVAHDSTFKGLMIFDKLHHIHMNILGAVVVVSPDPIVESCGGNDGHWIHYSSEAIKLPMKLPAEYSRGGWRQKLRVISWYE